MMIFSILVISGVYQSGEEPVYALAIGGMSGLLQLLVQVPFLIKMEYLKNKLCAFFSSGKKNNLSNECRNYWCCSCSN